MKYGLIYCRESEEDRKSKSKDAITTSIQNQLETGKKEAQIDQCNEILEFVDLNVHSTDVERKGFGSMIEFLSNHIVDDIRVYIKSYTRLGRANTYFELRRKLMDYVPKVDIYFYSEPSQDRINTEDDSIIGIKVYAHYIQIETNRKETAKLHKNKRESGKPYIKPPFGYKYDKNKDWIVDKANSIVVVEAFKLAIKGHSIMEISNSLKINRSKIGRILKNKCYTGIISHKRRIKNDIGKIIKIENVEYQGNYDPLITLDDWIKLS